MSVTIESKVGEIAANHPLATRVLARHGIDYCCGGGRPLREACEKKGIDAEHVLEELRQELERPAPADAVRWNEASLNDLIDHIVNRFHRPLDEELPRLEAMARKVVTVHGERDPETLHELLSVYLQLEEELQSHMMKEERILFPLIRRGLTAVAGGAIPVMEHEHQETGALLGRLRELTDGYRVPEGACNTWRALWHGLEALEKDMHDHIHLENNLLFPRAVA